MSKCFTMIHLNDVIKIPISGSRYKTKYKATCDKCGTDRGYLSKANALKPYCRKCCVRVTPESRRKMSAAKQGKAPWNKGKPEHRKEVREKLSLAKLGKAPPNKNKPMSYEQKIKLSCSARNIDLSEF
ncbi:MAG: NUMOD3 domain-containing DNA-binding protein, partial [Nitrososphaerales archaeon]